MNTQKLLISIILPHEPIPQEKADYHLWSLVYAHGQFEIDGNYDIVILNQEMPTEEGYYIAYTDDSKAVLIHLVANDHGIICGRCCYVDDYEALKYVNNPELWS